MSHNTQMSLQGYTAKGNRRNYLSLTMKPFREALTWLNKKSMKKPLTHSTGFWTKTRIIRKLFSIGDLFFLKLKNPRKPSIHSMKSFSLSLKTPMPSIEKEVVLQLWVSLKKPLKPMKVPLKFLRIILKPGI